MATSTVKKICFTCKKPKVIYSCPGCSKDFCLEDLNKHNQFVAEQFSVFQNECDQFRQKLIDGKKDSKTHPLLQQVNRWEEESINKIKQTANECRNLLNKHTKEIITGIETNLDGLAERLRSILRENEYDEMYLNRLKKDLKQLENEFAQPANISILQDPTSFIGKISIAITPTKVTKDATKPIVDPNQRSDIGVDVRAGSGVQGFTLPETFDEYCKGRLCAECGKCRDWYFTGDRNTWNWIRNWENWNNNDWTCWRNDRVWERFKRRDGATCRFGPFGGPPPPGNVWSQMSKEGEHKFPPPGPINPPSVWSRVSKSGEHKGDINPPNVWSRVSKGDVKKYGNGDNDCLCADNCSNKNNFFL